MDLFYWGGPVTSKQAKQVAWKRPTEILTYGRDGSNANAAVYDELSAADGFAWAEMARRAGIDPNQLGSLGIGGFSAFHGFANRMLLNPVDRSRVKYVHLADACFQGAASSDPKRGFVEFGKLAATDPDKLMVVTTNGPWGEDIHYCYEGTCYDLTSGALCMQRVWETVLAETGLSGEVRVPKTPAGVPAPTRAMAVGNLLWFHYENNDHAFHVHSIATPYMQAFGAPFMAGKTYPGEPSWLSRYSGPILALGIISAAGAAWWARNRNR